ncbi:quinone oxidoreductase-like [Glandiceps talaboti]
MSTIETKRRSLVSERVWGDATGGHGFDVIIEMLANINLQRDLEMLNRFGRIVIVGCRGKIEIDPKLTMIKETAILGLLLSQFSEEEYGEIVTAVYDGMTAGYIEPYVGREYPLHDSATAHRDIMDREIATIGRLAIVM